MSTDRELAFVYQEMTFDGSRSRFNKFVHRDASWPRFLHMAQPAAALPRSERVGGRRWHGNGNSAGMTKPDEHLPYAGTAEPFGG